MEARDQKGSPSHLVGASADYVIARGGEKDADELEATIVSAWNEDRFKGRKENPQRALIDRWHYVEVGCGCRAVMISNCTAQGLQCGPRIDILTHASLDVGSAQVVEWFFVRVQHTCVVHVYFLKCTHA